MTIQIGAEALSIDELINGLLKRGLIITIKAADELPDVRETFIVSCSACGWIGQPQPSRDAANRATRAHRAACPERAGGAEIALKSAITDWDDIEAEGSE